MTFNSDFLKNILYFQKMVQGRAPYGYIIYSGQIEQKIGTVTLTKNLNSLNCLQSFNFIKNDVKFGAPSSKFSKESSRPNLSIIFWILMKSMDPFS